jgi:hypothetical protein
LLPDIFHRRDFSKWLAVPSSAFNIEFFASTEELINSIRANISGLKVFFISIPVVIKEKE